MNEFKTNGVITVNLTNITPTELEYLRNVLRLLFGRGIFNLKGGKATLHFDFDGRLHAIDVERKEWQREKTTSLYKIYDRATIISQ